MTDTDTHMGDRIDVRAEILGDFVRSIPTYPSFLDELAQKRAIKPAWAQKLLIRRMTADVIRRAIAALVEKHGVSVVHLAGLTNERGEPAQALLHDNILIPYLNEDGSVSKVRPHKMGLPGDPVAVYCPFLLAETKATELVITEGEFKAIAACAAGIPCIAVPGISSFVGERYPELRDLLRRHGVRSATICFDNTDPKHADPAYPSGRDDTNFNALLLGRMLTEDGF